jgi:hypothetical protein
MIDFIFIDIIKLVICKYVHIFIDNMISYKNVYFLQKFYCYDLIYIYIYIYIEVNTLNSSH